jgi:hypothetical protein
MDELPICSWKQKLGMAGRLSCKRKVGLFSEHVGLILDGELSDDSGERPRNIEMMGMMRRRLNCDIAIGFFFIYYEEWLRAKLWYLQIINARQLIHHS